MSFDIHNVHKEYLNLRHLDEKHNLLRRIELMHTQKGLILPDVSDDQFLSLRRDYAQMLYSNEKQFVESVYNKKDQIFYKSIEYNWRANLEIQAAQMVVRSNFDTIMLIGSGPFPATAFYAVRSGFKVILVDREAEALSIASQIFKEEGISKYNKIHADAVCLESMPSNCIAIMAGTVGLSVLEKCDIISHIVDIMPDNSVLVVRLPMREESVLMADVVPEDSWNWLEISAESPTDYLRRLLVRSCIDQNGEN